MNKKARFGFIAAILFICLAAAYALFFTPSKKNVDKKTYFGVGEGEYGLIYNDSVVTASLYKEDDHWYLPFSTVFYDICDKLYYDGQSLLYTDPVQTYSTVPGEKNYCDEEGTKYRLEYTPCFFKDGGMYISLDYLQLMDYTYFNVYEDAGYIWMFNDWSERAAASVKKDTQLRYGSGIKKPVITEVKEDTQVCIIETGDTWSLVQLDNGLTGCIENRSLGEQSKKTKEVPDGRPLPEYTSISLGKTVVMGWHQVFSSSGVDKLDGIIEKAKGMNVICPTWFTISDNTGNIQNLGDREYVEKAHAAGLSVWVMLDDINIDTDDLQVFGTTAHRKNLITQVINAVNDLDADGVNLDLEKIKSDNAASLLQFVREMSAACRKNGLILSMDNYSPMPHTAFYDRTQQGEIIDYVIVMAYDEHYTGDDDAGSVSSIGFVERSAERTIEEVPKEKVIVGLPFYTRLWCETKSSGNEEDSKKVIDNSSGTLDSKYSMYTLTNKELGMDSARNYVNEHGLSLEWLSDVQQYYTEYQDGDSWYRLWMEDDKSIDCKLKTTFSYEPAGVAFFKLGLEDDKVWSIIRKYTE